MLKKVIATVVFFFVLVIPVQSHAATQNEMIQQLIAMVQQLQKLVDQYNALIAAQNAMQNASTTVGTVSATSTVTSTDVATLNAQTSQTLATTLPAITAMASQIKINTGTYSKADVCDWTKITYKTCTKQQNYLRVLLAQKVNSVAGYLPNYTDFLKYVLTNVVSLNVVAADTDVETSIELTPSLESMYIAWSSKSLTAQQQESMTLNNIK